MDKIKNNQGLHHVLDEVAHSRPASWCIYVILTHISLARCTFLPVSNEQSISLRSPTALTIMDFISSEGGVISCHPMGLRF